MTQGYAAHRPGTFIPKKGICLSLGELAQDSKARRPGRKKKNKGEARSSLAPEKGF